MILILNSQKCQYKIILTQQREKKFKFSLQPLFSKLHYLRYYHQQLLAFQNKSQALHCFYIIIGQSRSLLQNTTLLRPVQNYHLSLLCSQPDATTHTCTILPNNHRSRITDHTQPLPFRARTVSLNTNTNLPILPPSEIRRPRLMTRDTSPNCDIPWDSGTAIHYKKT